MTPRSLFNIILKILGIFFIKSFLELIPYILSSVPFIVREDTRTEGIWTLLSSLCILMVYWFMFYYLIFKTELIIDQLKLDKGFDQETIPLNIHRSIILSICCIVIGGYLVVSEIPELCYRTYLYFMQRRLSYGETPFADNLIYSVVKVALGIILMLMQRQIVNFIELRRKKS
jgi:hypothetical protein